MTPEEKHDLSKLKPSQLLDITLTDPNELAAKLDPRYHKAAVKAFHTIMGETAGQIIEKAVQARKIE